MNSYTVASGAGATELGSPHNRAADPADDAKIQNMRDAIADQIPFQGPTPPRPR